MCGCVVPGGGGTVFENTSSKPADGRCCPSLLLYTHQIEEPKADDCRVAMVFTSTGLPLALGADVLDSMETRYDVIFESSVEKEEFLVAVRRHWSGCVVSSCVWASLCFVFPLPASLLCLSI